MKIARNAKANGGWTGITILLASVVLVIFGLFVRYGDNDIFQQAHGDLTASSELPAAGPQDILTADFTICDESDRRDCVVDGDTIWFRGDKIRVLDINSPETSTPSCDQEFALGKAATERLRQLLNAGPFSLESGPEETDRYGRKLRRITRGGKSLGDILVAEGLAERWQGFRRNWC
ncbi:thermonuclease family protein [Croceicoccus ponticola]|uniref:Thermonuclease family protein n=1 Tax=Croceicoccus ponticola TaxID=2217664 RepID=A0A437GVH7_9SPHN|nr:thermonuclease family protein [Croceicoccus ponticola]RVQ65509.1 thermonuclease family protein [Croceicoccus ponticola]